MKNMRAKSNQIVSTETGFQQEKRGIEIKKAFSIFNQEGHIIPGNDLLSHLVTKAVPSAQEGLTTLFGMGRGVTPPPKSPEFFKFIK